MNNRIASILAICSGLLLALAYPPTNLWPLAWIALAPLVFVILQSSSSPASKSIIPRFFSSFILPNSSFRLGFFSGLVFWLCDLYWLLWLGATGEGLPRWMLWVFAVLAWLGLSAFCALGFGLWAVSLSALGKRFNATSAHGSLAITALGSAAWVALEWLRAHIWIGFPWNQLGVSQWKNLLLIQIAEQTGVYGVSFTLGFFNLAVACSLQTLKSNLWRPKPVLYVALGLTAAALTNGMFSIIAQGGTHTSGARVLSVAIVQGNIAQNDKWRAANEGKILQQYVELTHRAFAAKPELIVWPETSTPRPLNFDRATNDAVTALAREGKTYLLVGTIDGQVVGDAIKAQGNAAFLIGPDGKLASGPYWKMHLVPFGEYIPLGGMFPSLKNLAGLPTIDAGNDLHVFSMKFPSPAPAGEAQVTTGDSPWRGEGAKFSVLICFEDTFASLAREFVRRDAQFLVNITNDAWWGRSAGAEQHAANAVFRAVENRVWLVRCANTGLSCFVSPTGQIVQSVPPFTAGFATATITSPQGHHLTFYTKYGDVFALACVAAIMIWLTIEGLTYARRPSSQT